MARRKSKRESKNRTSPTSTPRTLAVRHEPRLVELPKRKPSPLPHIDFRPVEDLRHARKEPVVQREPFRTVSGRVARTEHRPSHDLQGRMPNRWLSQPMHDYFTSPDRVLVCIRRDTRARVLHALRKIGRGRKVSRVHRFSEKSRVRCK